VSIRRRGVIIGIWKIKLEKEPLPRIIQEKSFTGQRIPKFALSPHLVKPIDTKSS